MCIHCGGLDPSCVHCAEPMPDNGRRPFTEDELFSWERAEVQAVQVCSECGAAVILTQTHTEWHNKVADL